MTFLVSEGFGAYSEGGHRHRSKARIAHLNSQTTFQPNYLEYQAFKKNSFYVLKSQQTGFDQHRLIDKISRICCKGVNCAGI